MKARAEAKIHEEYKKLVAEWLIDKKIIDFVSSLLIEYVNKTVIFFKENNMAFTSDEALIDFIKENSPHHIKGVLNAIFDRSLDVLKPLMVH